MIRFITTLLFLSTFSISEAVDCNELINAVHRRPVIWGQHRVTDTEGYANAWADIASEMNTAVPTVVSLWNQLRQNYVREYDRILNSMLNIHHERITGWVHYEQMRFLFPHLTLDEYLSAPGTQLIPCPCMFERRRLYNVTHSTFTEYNSSGATYEPYVPQGSGAYEYQRTASTQYQYPTSFVPQTSSYFDLTPINGSTSYISTQWGRNELSYGQRSLQPGYWNTTLFSSSTAQHNRPFRGRPAEHYTSQFYETRRASNNSYWRQLYVLRNSTPAVDVIDLSQPQISTPPYTQMLANPHSSYPRRTGQLDVQYSVTDSRRTIYPPLTGYSSGQNYVPVTESYLVPRLRIARCNASWNTPITARGQQNYPPQNYVPTTTVASNLNSQHILYPTSSTSQNPCSSCSHSLGGAENLSQRTSGQTNGPIAGPSRNQTTPDTAAENQSNQLNENQNIYLKRECTTPDESSQTTTDNNSLNDSSEQENDGQLEQIQLSQRESTEHLLILLLAAFQNALNAHPRTN